ncbi:hypothetical protein J3F83DRAFT_281053 [Trichoderma novae-zelandiae]
MEGMPFPQVFAPGPPWERPQNRLGVGGTRQCPSLFGVFRTSYARICSGRGSTSACTRSAARVLGNSRLFQCTRLPPSRRHHAEYQVLGCTCSSCRWRPTWTAHHHTSTSTMSVYPCRDQDSEAAEAAAAPTRELALHIHHHYRRGGSAWFWHHPRLGWWNDSPFGQLCSIIRPASLGPLDRDPTRKPDPDSVHNAISRVRRSLLMTSRTCSRKSAGRSGSCLRVSRSGPAASLSPLWHTGRDETRSSYQ